MLRRLRAVRGQWEARRRRLGEHLPAQLGGPRRGFFDLQDAFAGWRPGRQVHQRQIGVGQDPREQIVEVVGDGAGQGADALGARSKTGRMR